MAAERGDHFAVSVWTGASTAPELDGALAAVDGIDLRMPYQSDPVTRAKINAGLLDYLDIHLSHVAQMVVGGLLRPSRRRPGRGRRGHRRRGADPVVLGRQQQDLDRPGRPGHPRGELLAARRARGHARHLLRHRAAPEPHADPDPPADRPHRRCRTCAARRRRSSPSCRRNSARLATPSKPADADRAADRRSRPGFPDARGEDAAACPPRCCRSSPASATSPMPCWPGSTTGRSRR